MKEKKERLEREHAEKEREQKRKDDYVVDSPTKRQRVEEGLVVVEQEGVGVVAGRSKTRWGKYKRNSKRNPRQRKNT